MDLTEIESKKIMAKLINVLSNKLEEIDKLFIQRRNKSHQISFESLLFFSCLLLNSKSYQEAAASFNVKRKEIFDATAFHKRRNSANLEHFSAMTDTLINFIYTELRSPRIFAVDGSSFNMPFELSKHGFSLAEHKEYTHVHINGIFDTELRMPIDYGYSPGQKNERQLLINQLHLFKKGDTLVMDRGYYSRELLYTLNEKGIKSIFRLRKDIAARLVTDDEGNTVVKIDKNRSVKARLITYDVENTTYYILTTCRGKDAEFFKEQYWARWRIEVHFKHAKYDIVQHNMRAKTPHQLAIDFKVMTFIGLLTSIVEKIAKPKDLDEGKKINTQVCISVIVNSMMETLLCRESRKEALDDIWILIKIIGKNIVTSKSGRKYDRRRIIPASKWSRSGSRYGSGKKANPPT